MNPRDSDPRRRNYSTGACARVFSVAAIVLAIVVVVGRQARAAAFDIADTGWEGTSQLLEIARSELGAARVHPVAVLNWEEVQPEDGVLVLHPLKGMDPDDTTAFMKAGGRLAILDDYGMGDETLSRFHIERIPPPLRPVRALRDRAALAIAEPVIDTVAGHSSGPHPVVAHVQQLVTNHPMGLRHPNLSPVLRIRAIGEPDVVIAVAGQVGKGRLFAMSDPSVAINEMLRYPGNRGFVAGLVRYLVDDDGSQRRQGRLFLVANRFGEENSFGGKSSLRKDFESHMKALLEALADARRNGLPAFAHVLLAGLVAALIGLWTVRTAGRPYQRPLPRYARAVPLVAQGGIAGRLAVLAAPSSPRSLVLLELKSALVEALQAKLQIRRSLTVDELVNQAIHAGMLDERTYIALRSVLDTMRRVESQVLQGRAPRLSEKTILDAAEIVHEVLDTCGLPLPKRPVEADAAASDAGARPGGQLGEITG